MEKATVQRALTDDLARQSSLLTLETIFDADERTLTRTHPNPTIQFANRATLISAILGVTSILLGVIALALTIYSIYITLNPCKV